MENVFSVPGEIKDHITGAMRALTRDSVQPRPCLFR